MGQPEFSAIVVFDEVAAAEIVDEVLSVNHDVEVAAEAEAVVLQACSAYLLEVGFLSTETVWKVAASHGRSENEVFRQE
jgi:hypothetical protein